jgi:copper chaperone
MLLSVQKMTCGHCVRAVTAAIRALDPDAAVEVDLVAGTVHVSSTADADAVIRAIGEEGYPAQVVEG